MYTYEQSILISFKRIYYVPENYLINKIISKHTAVETNNKLYNYQYLFKFFFFNLHKIVSL